MRWPWQKPEELNLGTPSEEPVAPRRSPDEPTDPDAPPAQLGADRRWDAGPPADRDQLGELAVAAGERIPPSMLRFLAWSDGGEGPLAAEPGWLQLDSTAFLLNTLEDPDLAAVNEAVLMIGQGSAEQWIALDVRSGQPAPVVWFDGDLLDGFEGALADGTLDERLHPLAADFDALVQLIGRTADQ